jgi:hypothetical protein
MNDEPKSLAAWDDGAPPAALLRGTATAASELLRSPASGAACVHWRLRIYETVAAGAELVHEVMAHEPFDLAWREDPTLPPRPVRLASERVNIEAQPTLHAEGSPGALAVAGHFGLSGKVRVEEVLLRQGADLEAEGLLFDPQAVEAGPYRGHQGRAELFEATVRLSTGMALRPALLPWALGTAAALLTAAGAATALSRLRLFGMEVSLPGERYPGPVDSPGRQGIGPVKPKRTGLWP